MFTQCYPMMLYHLCDFFAFWVFSMADAGATLMENVVADFMCDCAFSQVLRPDFYVFHTVVIVGSSILRVKLFSRVYWRRRRTTKISRYVLRDLICFLYTQHINHLNGRGSKQYCLSRIKYGGYYTGYFLFEVLD